MSYNFVVIDDDFINNIICAKIIGSELPASRLEIFSDAQKGLDYINCAGAEAGEYLFIVLLDINMPAINGWEFLEQLQKSPKITQRLKIFLMSSSVSPEDKQQANDHLLVSGYIEKPLTQTILKNILKQQ